MPRADRVHYGVHVNGVHTYRPRNEIAAVEPRSLIGAWAIPLVPDHYAQVKQQASGVETLSYEQTYDLANIRSGYQPQDDYLLLNGGNTLPANTLVRLMSHGHLWLSHTAANNPYDQSRLPG